MDDGQCATCGAPASAASAAGVAAVAAAGAMGGQQQQQRCGACGAAYGGEAAPPPELGRAIIADLMRSLKAYDVMAESNKVIVFDVTVPVRLAFYALVEHDASCAPLWDSTRCCFAGALTMSDIIDIMRVFYTPASTGASVAAALTELTISSWREYASQLTLSGAVSLSSPDMHWLASADAAARSASAAAESAAAVAVAAAGGAGVGAGARAGSGGGGNTDHMSDVGGISLSVGGVGGGGSAAAAAAASAAATAAAAVAAAAAAKRRRPGLIAIDPEDDLFAVVHKLRRHRIHHMPILDVEQNAVASVLSHRSLLTLILSRFSDSRRLFDTSLYALGIGSFDDVVVVVPEGASVISVLHVLAERRISAVPVVNAGGQVVAVYGREDVSFLANDPSLMVLDAPVGEVRRAQVAMMGASRPIVMCSRTDTLHRALELFAATGGRSSSCERLICVDEQQRCTGVVSLSDIFSFFTSTGPITLRQ